MSLPSTIKEILQKLADNKTEKVKVAITDMDGILRGKVISYEKFVSIVEKGFGFCDVVFGWDAGDVAYDNASITGWHTGYPDTTAMVDVQTFRQIPWENDLALFLADFSGPESSARSICPRTLLKTIRKQANDAGFIPYFSQEFEWFNFIDNKEELYKNGFRNPVPMTPGMFGYSVLRASQESNYFHDLN